MKTALAVLVLSTAAAAGEQQVRTESTDEFSFAAGGTVELRDSFGRVKVEAWDSDTVELRVIKRTQKKYKPHDEDDARRHLDRIRIAATLVHPNRLTIETEFPPRNVFTRPLKGKTNVDLEYHIKVPRRCSLEIRHDVGEVVVEGVLGDLAVTNRIGAIGLRLPPSESYWVDARAKIGDVSSEFDPPARRRLLVGASLVGDAHQTAAYRIYARVGIGEVSVRRMGTD